MPTLGDFNTLVKDTIRLGSRVDGLILAGVRQAVLFLERNYNFRYMFTSEVVFFNGTTGRGPYVMGNVPKRMEGVGTRGVFAEAASQFYWMDKIALKDVDNYPIERPKAYEIRGEKDLWINSVPDDVYYGVAYYYKYSTFPSITTANMYDSTDSLWLISYGEDLLLHQTLIQLSVPLKNVELATISRPLRDEALHTLLATEDNLEQGDESPAMLYGGSYGGN